MSVLPPPAPGALLPEDSLFLGLGPESLVFVEGLFDDFLQNPESVPAEWREYFARFAQGNGKQPQFPVRPHFPQQTLFNPPGPTAALPADTAHTAVAQERVDQLMRNFRSRGHIIAQIDPLGRPRHPTPELQLESYGFTPSDYDCKFSTHISHGPNVRTLREILEWMQTTYCRSIGVQFMHIDELSVRQWLQDHMEESQNRITLRRDEQLRILTRLTDAVVFEEFLQKKYVGAKSFSLEGAESLIPLLDLAIERAGEDGIREIVLGMAHRGRLNVLANIVGKNPRDIFREYEDRDPQLHTGRGDVKYHLGYSTDWKTVSGKSVHISLCFNPSHLEFVNPVALGRLRAKQDRFNDLDRRHGMVILIHGDAAFAGEGIIQETLNLSELHAYKTGGTIHVIVNNQIGFTTDPSEARSSQYATDVAKMLQIPIFHVNGEDAEAVAQVIRLAMDFRKEFQRDVVIDMYCYRRRGHNEGDEPAFTQPPMYKAIEKRKSVRQGYLGHLLTLGEVTREEADSIAEQRRAHLENELAYARSDDYVPRIELPPGIWSGYQGGSETEAVEAESGVKMSRLKSLLESQTRLPADFHPHPKVERVLAARLEMAQGAKPLDWAAGEALAFATLATEWNRVRLTGQDVGRGTFSHRHAVLHDCIDGHTYTPLQHLSDDQAPVEIYNSPLSEAGVLGFEYGYSLDCPDGLILWEAQFGDFSNAAQVIIDQFIISAEEKWRRLSGLVLLLPHGMEGQGPEHSSARLERFLELFAEDNIQVVCVTTPAQYFHVLRRQLLRSWQKPLIIMTPKSLLRHPQAVSSLEDCARGRFRRVLPDHQPASQQVKRILLCTGKIYYELAKRREEQKRNDVAILRVEQLAPVPYDELHEALAGYADGTPAYWVQEEPENMGAWRHLYVHFGTQLDGRLPFTRISRPAAGSPATGSGTSHKLEQEQLLTAAFGDGRVQLRRPSKAAR